MKNIFSIFTIFLYSICNCYSQIDSKIRFEIDEYASKVDSTIDKFGYAFNIGCGDWGSQSNYYDSIQTYKIERTLFIKELVVTTKQYFKNSSPLLTLIQCNENNTAIYTRRIYQQNKYKFDETIVGKIRNLPRQARKGIKKVL